MWQASTNSILAEPGRGQGRRHAGPIRFHIGHGSRFDYSMEWRTDDVSLASAPWRG
jgi:hypothetical protein